MTCPSREQLIAAIDGEATLNETSLVRAHAATCAECSSTEARLRALTRQLGASVAPPDPRFVSDVLRRLPEAGPRRPIRWVPALAACGLLALAGAAALLNDRSSDFTARGGSGPLTPARHLGIEARVHHDASTTLLQAGDALRADDGLSFIVLNRSRRAQHLLLFGVDARGEVHWFTPAFSRPDEDPRSTPLPAAPERSPLPEGVTMEAPAAGAFQLVALFSPEPLRARAIEEHLSRNPVETLEAAFAGSTVELLPLQLKAP